MVIMYCNVSMSSNAMFSLIIDQIYIINVSPTLGKSIGKFTITVLVGYKELPYTT